MTKRSKRLTQAQRFEELRHFVTLCFTMLDGDDTVAGLVTTTGLSKTTVYRLWRGQFTLAVRYGTIQALGAAVGLRLVMTDTAARVQVA